MSVQVVAGLFLEEGFFDNALAEFRWSVRQNAAFWKQAVLYVDPPSAPHIERYRDCFREVVVDHELPPEVAAHRRWRCKGWWPRQAVQRFGRILYCDFDIFVRKQPDELLWQSLNNAPQFLHMQGYNSPTKVVGCGVVYYDENCDWDAFQQVLYHEINCDERSWTRVLELTREKQLATGRTMNPYIVNHDWLVSRPDQREQTYIIHGISAVDGGRRRLRAIGYSEAEIRFKGTLKQTLAYHLSVLRGHRDSA